MTLWEVLLQYNDIACEHGRQKADEFLHATVDECLWEHIRSNFDDEGGLIDANGERVYCYVEHY